MGFRPFKTDKIAHYFVLIMFFNTRLSAFFLTLGHLYARTDADFDPTQPPRISLEISLKTALDKAQTTEVVSVIKGGLRQRLSLSEGGDCKADRSLVWIGRSVLIFPVPFYNL